MPPQPSASVAHVALALCAALPAAMVGCQRQPPTATPPAVERAAEQAAGTAAPAVATSAASDEEARAIFAQRCTMCHGTSGHGDGPAAAGLTPKPRNYADVAWQRATDDKEITLAIVGGGPAVGKSLMMPANPDLKDRPEVVAGLLKIVRAFGAP